MSKDDPTAAALRGFGPLGLAAVLISLLAGNIAVDKLPVIPAGGVLVLLWAAAFDLTALALIYWNLERIVAQLIFK